MGGVGPAQGPNGDGAITNNFYFLKNDPHDPQADIFPSAGAQYLGFIQLLSFDIAQNSLRQR